MAITDLELAMAGMQPPVNFFKQTRTMEAIGQPHCLYDTLGCPSGRDAGAPTAYSDDAVVYSEGFLPFTNPSSGNTYLARLTANSTQAGRLILVDWLYNNWSSINPNTTTAQTLNTGTLPARDANGGTSGDGVMVALLAIQNPSTNGSPITNTTMSYTNSDGTSSQTGTLPSWPATAVRNTFVPFRLAANDTGVESVETLTLGTSYGSFWLNLVLYREIAALDLPGANISASIDLLSSGMPRLFDDSALMLLWVPSATTTATISGQLIYTQG